MGKIIDIELSKSDIDAIKIEGVTGANIKIKQDLSYDEKLIVTILQSAINICKKKYNVELNYSLNKKDLLDE